MRAFELMKPEFEKLLLINKPIIDISNIYTGDINYSSSACCCCTMSYSNIIECNKECLLCNKRAYNTRSSFIYEM